MQVKFSRLSRLHDSINLFLIVIIIQNLLCSILVEWRQKRSSELRSQKTLISDPPAVDLLLISLPTYLNYSAQK